MSIFIFIKCEINANSESITAAPIRSLTSRSYLSIEHALFTRDDRQPRKIYLTVSSALCVAAVQTAFEEIATLDARFTAVSPDFPEQEIDLAALLLARWPDQTHPKHHLANAPNVFGRAQICETRKSTTRSKGSKPKA